MKHLADAMRKWLQLNYKIDQRPVLFPPNRFFSFDDGSAGVDKADTTRG
jgi:hypothetical protein